MIYIYIDHGLGNQMFQYAFGTILAKKLGRKYVKFDTSYLPDNIEGRKTWSIEDIFSTKFPKASSIELWCKTGNCPYLYKRYTQNNVSVDTTPLNKKCIYIHESVGYKVTFNEIEKIKNYKWDTNKDYYVCGFWEEFEYLKGYEKFLQKIFTFKHIITNIEKKKFRQIFENNSVSVHVRRGDYLNIKKDAKMYLCKKNYYKNAMNIIEKQIKDPYYIFFTDDPAFVKKEYAEIKNKIVIEGNKDYIDMQLMSCCKHNIVTNSTFSFWGAFLNKNKNKIVIAPKVHYLVNRGGWRERKMPVDETWISINNS